LLSGVHAAQLKFGLLCYFDVSQETCTCSGHLCDFKVRFKFWNNARVNMVLYTYCAVCTVGTKRTVERTVV